MKLQSLEDLKQLLTESEQKKLNDANPQKKLSHDGKGKSLRVYLDSKGRKGKSVTVITGFQHNPDTMDDIAKTLKQYCGAGGTVKGLEIEIQGDQRIRVTGKLQELNYVVK
jgi:translation initiation factor 1